MNSIEISNILRSNKVTAPYFAGVCSQDELFDFIYPSCQSHKQKRFIIVNTDIESGRGKHWTSIFLFGNNYCEFFDSLAHDPSYYSKNFLQFLKCACSKYAMNTRRIQGQASTMCGEFCIYYCYYRCKGVAFMQIVDRFNAENLNLNDRKLQKFIHSM